VLGGDVAIAMSYVDGDWDSDDLVTLFRLIARGSDAGTPLRWATLARIGQRLGHAWRANTRRGSRRNIRAHYDLGNDFFGLWLDDTRSYSSAIFASSATTLYEASLAKLDRVCQRLRLQRGDHLLEIGTGWGGLALHAARHYGCRVTTTTISQEQYEFARQRVAEAGLQARVQVLLQDYRDLTGCFDKLVSIEMIEAVGHRYLDTFFGQCSKLLAPGGTMLLQAIVMPERRYDNYLASVDFIRHAIFPGGSLPSVAAMLESIGRTSSLRFVAAQDFAPHYAETLRRWREAFCGNLAEVRLQGYPEQFIRLWDYYLCYCEAAFAERQIGLLQLEFEQPARNYPRSYLPKTMARDVTAAQASCPVGELP
jgi:cyclopropane-fatty-acyl-phospholipid synthase